MPDQCPGSASPPAAETPRPVAAAGEQGPTGGPGRVDEPSSAGEPGPAEESLVDAFWAVARELRHRARDALAPWDVTPGQARALAVLRRHGAMRLGALSEHLRIVPRSATEVVDALEERGLVARTADPADRRATLVALTPHGAEVSVAIHAARVEGAQDVFDRLTDADRTALARILRSLHPPVREEGR